MPLNLPRLLRHFRANPPAAAEAIDKAQALLGVSLPGQYIELLSTADGGDGFVGGGYLILWRIGELAALNDAYEVRRHAPGLLLFASDGCGDAFGFDMREAAMPIVRVPFVGMNWEFAEDAGPDVGDWLHRLSQVEPPAAAAGQSRQAHPGGEIFEITPILLGGDPTDPANKAVLARADHVRAVAFWNSIIRQVPAPEPEEPAP